MEKITELIDEKAFLQLEKLLKDLGIAQSEFISLTTNVSQFNAEMSKVKGFKEFETAVTKLSDAHEKMEKAQEKVISSQDKAIKAEKELVKATRLNITTGMDAKKLLDAYSGTIDENVRKQVKMKLAISDVQNARKKAAKDLSDQKITTEQYNDELVKLARMEFEAREALREHNLEIRRSIKEAKEAENSNAQRAATLDRLRGLMRKLTDEEKANVEIGGKLQKAIDEYDTELKKADASLGVHTRHVGHYENALANIPGPIGKLISGWDDLVNMSNSVTQSLDNSNDTFTTLTTSMDSVSFVSDEASEALEAVGLAGENTGEGLATAEQGTKGFVAGLKSIIRAGIAFIATPIGATIAAISAGLLAARGWYQYNKDLVEATRLTKQFTGLGGDDLKAFRSEIMATAKTFDRDFKEVLIAVNSTSKQFGISQQEALGIINKGFLAGADASGEFLDQLREYPSQLKAVGLSAEETAAIITQTTQEGIYSDKGIDAIKEAGIRIREMTQPTKDAFKAIGLSSEEIQRQLQEGTVSMFDVIQKVSARLKELPETSQEVGMALADIFAGPGEDAGIKYIQSLADIDLSLDNLVDKQGDVAKAQELQLQATEKLDKAFASLFDSTGGGFELMIANGKLFATNVLVAIVDNLIKVVNWGIELYNESILIRGAFQAVGVVFSNAFDIIAFGFKRALEGAKTFGKIFKAIMTGNFKEIPGIIADGFNSQVNAVKTLGKDVAQNYVDAFNNTVRNKKIEKITPGLATTGAASAGGGGGGNGVTRTLEDENNLTKEQIDLIKRLRDAYYDLGIARSERGAELSKRVAEDEKQSFEDRDRNLNDYLFKKAQSIRLGAQKELEAEGLTADERTRIEEQLQADLEDLKREGAAMSLQILNDLISEEDKARLKGAANALSAIEIERDTRLEALNKSFSGGEIAEKEYANERLKIQREYARKLVEQEIKAVEQLIEVNKAKGIDTFEQEKQLAALKLKLSQETTDKQIEDANRLLEEEKKINEARAQLVDELANLATELVLGQFERENQALDAQSEKIELNKEKQKERIEESVISEQDKAIKLAQIEAKAQKDQEKLDERRRQLQQRQAVFERAAAIARIVQNTAAAIMVQLAGAPLFPISGPLIPIIAGIGAAQIASVVSAPLPAFAEGTESSPAGWALTDEKGAETYIEPGGRMYFGSDSGPNYKFLKKGTKIIPADESRGIMAMAGWGSIANYNKGGDFKTDQLEKISKDGFNRLEKSLNSKKSSSTILTKGGMKHIYKSGTSTQEYLNRNL